MAWRMRLLKSVIIILAAAGLEGCAAKSSSRQLRDPSSPPTVEQAVEILKTEWLSESNLDWILRNPKDYVTATLHLPFGTAVRNAFGLWERHSELLKSCGVRHPEACSGIIFERLWESVRQDAHPELISRLDCQYRLIESIQITYRGFYKLRLGEVLEQVQSQIDQQQPQSGCQSALTLRPTGGPDLNCWNRAEFSEDGFDPVPLGLFVGWLSVRNGFRILHSPPEIQLPFYNKCAWPEIPTHFRPGTP